jgi:hypothetical protein
MMAEDIILMSLKELKRLPVLQNVVDKKLTQKEASDLLGLCVRQVRRILKRFGTEGEGSLVHRLRGKPSNQRNSHKDKILKLYQERYPDFGPTLACEKLLEIHRLRISDETLRLWLIQKGLRQVGKRRKHRQWRPRKASFGQMIQVDGSHHDWFEGRGPKCVLMGFIDDATNHRFARFYEYEGTLPAMDALRRYILLHGIPQSIYLDRHSTYCSTAKSTLGDELEGLKPMSQFERATKDLGITLIHAQSAPAKGRIERDFKTYQDRLVKEMRLVGISSIQKANAFLGRFLPRHNKRFGFVASNAANLHSPAPKDIDLEAVLCIKTERFLRNDFTVAHKKALYQILGKVLGKSIVVEEHTNGCLFMTLKGKRLRYKKILDRPLALTPKPLPKARVVTRPSMEHPLKRAFYQRRLVLESQKKQNEQQPITV